MSFSSIASLQHPRRVITSFIFFIAALLMAYTASRYIVSNDLSSLAITALVLAGSAIVVVVVKSWRQGLYFFLGWLLFEDLARKFLGNNMAIYFAKDALLLIVYLSFLAAYRRKDQNVQAFRPPFLPVLYVFIWFGAIQM